MSKNADATGKQRSTPPLAEAESELSILKEILRWVRFSGMKEVGTLLDRVLDDEKKKQAFQLSDGTCGTEEVGKTVGLGAETVRRLWKQWAKLGLGESKAVRGGERFVRSFDLADFGLEVKVSEKRPPISQSESVTTPATDNSQQTLSVTS